MVNKLDKIYDKLKVTMVHGNKDRSVPINYSRRVLRIFKNLNYRLHFLCLLFCPFHDSSHTFGLLVLPFVFPGVPFPHSQGRHKFHGRTRQYFHTLF